MTEHSLLGEILVGRGLVSAADLDIALRHQQIAGGRLGANLIALGLLTSDQLAEVLRYQREIAGAVSGCERSLAKLVAGLGPNHPNSLRARINLARLLLLAGRTVEALNMGQIALGTLGTMLGAGHEWTREAAAIVGDALGAQQRAAAPPSVAF